MCQSLTLARKREIQTSKLDCFQERLEFKVDVQYTFQHDKILYLKPARIMKWVRKCYPKYAPGNATSSTFPGTHEIIVEGWCSTCCPHVSFVDNNSDLDLHTFECDKLVIPTSAMLSHAWQPQVKPNTSHQSPADAYTG